LTGCGLRHIIQPVNFANALTLGGIARRENVDNLANKWYSKAMESEPQKLEIGDKASIEDVPAGGSHVFIVDDKNCMLRRDDGPYVRGGRETQGPFVIFIATKGADEQWLCAPGDLKLEAGTNVEIVANDVR
jgi:hypothetical protein